MTKYSGAKFVEENKGTAINLEHARDGDEGATWLADTGSYKF